MRYAALLLALALAGCGNETTNPSDTGDVSGTWAGTYSSAQIGAGSVRLSLVQSGSNVTGTWSTSSNAGGVGAGTVSGTQPTRARAGTFTLALTPSDPRTCPFSATLTYNLPTTMNGQWVTTNCTVTATGTFSLTK